MNGRDVYVLGIGQTRFGVDPVATAVDLIENASLLALKDAGINPKELQTAYAGNCYGVSTVGQMGLIRAGIGDIPITNVTNACASGNTAVHSLFKDITAGFCDVGIAIGFESMTQMQKERGSKGLLAMRQDLGGMLGLTMPGFFSFVYERLKAERGATLEDLCYPTIKNHYNGQFNPLAAYHKVLTLEQVLESPKIVGDITTLQCCPQSDGAAALILCSEEYFNKHNVNNCAKIKISASVLQSSGWMTVDKDPVYSHVMRKTGDMAYEMAGIRPGDVDLVELHDAFSGEEIAAYEPLHLCEDGKCIEAMRNGDFDLNGRLPVNPSGGLLSLGHPLGASGARVNCEVVRQLRGQSGENQVRGAKRGLAQMLGSVILGGLESAVVCGVQILERVD